MQAGTVVIIAGSHAGGQGTQGSHGSHHGSHLAALGSIGHYLSHDGWHQIVAEGQLEQRHAAGGILVVHGAYRVSR